MEPNDKSYWCFCVKQAQGHICLNRAQEYKLAVHQVKIKKKMAGTWFQAQKSENWLIPTHRCQGDGKCQFLILSISSASATDLQDLASLWHSVTMPKDFKLWGRTLCIDLHEKPSFSWKICGLLKLDARADNQFRINNGSILCKRKFCVFIARTILISHNLGSFFMVSTINPILTLGSTNDCWDLDMH